MRTEVKIGSIRNPHQLVPLPFVLFTFREEPVLNINRPLGVVGQLFLWLLVEPQIFGGDSQTREPIETTINPLLMRFLIFTGTNKVFHLHLFKLTRAKDEVARCYFVAKRFADLRDTKRKLAAAGCQHVNKINEDSLRGFGAQVTKRL